MPPYGCSYVVPMVPMALQSIRENPHWCLSGVVPLQQRLLNVLMVAVHGKWGSRTRANAL